MTVKLKFFDITNCGTAKPNTWLSIQYIGTIKQDLLIENTKVSDSLLNWQCFQLWKSISYKEIEIKIHKLYLNFEGFFRQEVAFEISIKNKKTLQNYVRKSIRNDGYFKILKIEKKKQFSFKCSNFFVNDVVSWMYIFYSFFICSLKNINEEKIIFLEKKCENLQWFF